MFTDKCFRQYKNYIYAETGINILPAKKSMLQLKIDKVLRETGLDSYEDYFSLLTKSDNDGVKASFFNTITTNTTEFFRENAHFEYITNNIEKILTQIPRIRQNGEIRIWCAASSSGQEPITLAMVFKECLDSNINVKILATDISTKVLKNAMEGIYTEKQCSEIPKYYLNKYFIKVADGYRVCDEIMRCINYRYFNLMNTYKSKYGFDIIMCRNVMIYFDNEIQEQLINRFYKNLVSEGLLFIGLSESLINKSHEYIYLSPSIYKK